MIKQPEQNKEGKKLPLVEDFFSIQGEGFHTGRAAYFIRLGAVGAIHLSHGITKYTH